MVARSGMVQPSWANDHVVYECKIRFGGALGKNKCHRRSDARARKGILSLSSNSSLPSEGQHGALHQNYLHASIPCTELRAMYACHHCLRANYPQGGIRREVSELTHLTTLVLSSNLLKGMMPTCWLGQEPKSSAVLARCCWSSSWASTPQLDHNPCSWEGVSCSILDHRVFLPDGVLSCSCTSHPLPCSSSPHTPFHAQFTAEPVQRNLNKQQQVISSSGPWTASTRTKMMTSSPRLSPTMA